MFAAASLEPPFARIARQFKAGFAGSYLQRIADRDAAVAHY